jgi:tetratricopeptide (TPR) repeat protein
MLFNALMEQKKVLQAIRLMQFKIDKDPDFMAAYNNISFALASVKKEEDAIAILKKALSRGVSNASTARIIINLAGMLAKKGDVEEAQAILKDNMNKYPSFAPKFRQRLSVLEKIPQKPPQII